MGGELPLNIIGFGNRDNQICVQPFDGDFRKRHTGTVFGNTKLIGNRVANVNHREHKTELTFYASLQPNKKKLISHAV